MHLPPELIQHAPSPFGEPVSNACVESNDGYGIESVVEVGYHKVGVMHVDVGSTGAQVNACYTSNEEFDDERKGPKHRCLETDGTPIQGGYVEKAKLGDGNGNQQGGDGE